MPGCDADSVPSVAEIDCVPTVFRVTRNDREPASDAVNTVGGGRVACASVEVKETVPRYPVATLPYTSFAVTIRTPADPAVVGLGNAPAVRDAAAPPRTWMPCCVPCIDGVRVSAAVTLWLPAVPRTTPET